MSILQAVILGIVQGLTEFLPISSTAHLRIVPALLGWDDPGAAFTAVIQIGTLAAVLTYFYQDIARISQATLKATLAGNPLGEPDAKMGWMIVAGTLPIVVAGVLFKQAIETTLRSLYVIAAAMIGLALLLTLAEYQLQQRLMRKEKLKSIADISWFESLTVGFAQCLALIPGASRSGVTITSGLLLGLEREAAARFSFLLSLPSVFAAGIFQLIKSREALLASQEHVLALLTATLVSGVVGYASIALLLGYLRKNSTAIFIIYRIAVGAGILALVLSGKLSAD
ncbi:MAG: undecaprenyl-diphosphatase UppP [Chloroherpetonaceae bacterium]|nr:undecaprenyl-diphosphatase UppP [Chloroherpetonaceae bacterium]MCS7210379.1 undecaprenyl-diphosphatase UppP [Chloroherpetonaceae bacterium]MDW8018947.1 undecaprenyl-diphosphatase UppP [Chloroherpetonaceae bacterium]MDW8465059.1 undecaprenyl-diphosphatase UppP [Chloroherpetonaceae bacterium]